MDEDRVLDVLGRGRAAGLRPDCLDDATLAALADGSLSAARSTASAAHLRDCVLCLHAYAAVRRLLDHPEPRPRLPIRRLLAARVPVAWTLATAAAAVILTWMVATTVVRRDAEPPSVIEMSGGPQAIETVAGTVTALERAGTEDAPAHVVEVVAAGGRRYIVFVWGAPTSRIGDHVAIDGHFSAEGGVRRGVATRLTVDAR